MKQQGPAPNYRPLGMRHANSSLPSTNPLCRHRVQLRSYFRHSDLVDTIMAGTAKNYSIDNRPPDAFLGVPGTSKKEYLRKTRQARILHENALLVEKIIGMETVGSSCEKRLQDLGITLDREKYTKSSKSNEKENAKLFKKIRQSKMFFSHEQWRKTTQTKERNRLRRKKRKTEVSIHTRRKKVEGKATKKPDRTSDVSVEVLREPVWDHRPNPLHPSTARRHAPSDDVAPNVQDCVDELYYLQAENSESESESESESDSLCDDDLGVNVDDDSSDDEFVAAADAATARAITTMPRPEHSRGRPQSAVVSASSASQDRQASKRRPQTSLPSYAHPLPPHRSSPRPGPPLSSCHSDRHADPLRRASPRPVSASAPAAATTATRNTLQGSRTQRGSTRARALHLRAGSMGREGEGRPNPTANATAGVRLLTDMLSYFEDLVACDAVRWSDRDAHSATADAFSLAVHSELARGSGCAGSESANAKPTVRKGGSAEGLSRPPRRPLSAPAPTRPHVHFPPHERGGDYGEAENNSPVRANSAVRQMSQPSHLPTSQLGSPRAEARMEGSSLRESQATGLSDSYADTFEDSLVGSFPCPRSITSAEGPSVTHDEVRYEEVRRDNGTTRGECGEVDIDIVSRNPGILVGESKEDSGYSPTDVDDPGILSNSSEAMGEEIDENIADGG
eukprot:Rmarinus@m.13481